jgi:hypothetical protein
MGQSSCICPIELSHVKVLAPFQMEKWVRKARREGTCLSVMLSRTARQLFYIFGEGLST